MEDCIKKMQIYNPDDDYKSVRQEESMMMLKTQMCSVKCEIMEIIKKMKVN